MTALVAVVVTLIVVGIVLYVVDLIPMNPQIATLIRAVIVIAAVLWVLAVICGWLGVVVPHSWRGVWR